MKHFLFILIWGIATARAASLPVSVDQDFYEDPAPAGGGGGGTPTLVFFSAKEGTAGGCTTGATNTTTSTLFISAMRGYRSPYPQASSSPANVYSSSNWVGSSGAAAGIDYFSNPTTSSSQTFSASGGDAGTQWSAIGSYGFTVVTTIDKSTNLTASATSFNPSLAVAQSGEVVVIALGADVGTNTWDFTINSSFILAEKGQTGGGYTFVTWYKIKTDAVTESPTITATGTGGSPNVGISMRAFK